MSLLRSIVVDDEPLARELVEGYVNQTPFLESAGSYPDALSAMEAIRNGMQAELLFLDIQMPNLSGLELSRLLPPEMKVIFTTAFEQYAVEGFRVEALDYLLKPVSAKLLFPLLDRLYQREQNPQDGLTVRSEGVLVRLPFSQLSYVEVMGKHLFFHMTDDSVHEVVGALKEYEGALLARPEVMRTHRSYIVNMLQAEKLSPAGVVTFSGRSVPVSRLLYNQLQKDYLELLFSGRDA